MTPEKAKPTEMVDEHGKPTLWFTAKETAEIAKSYAYSCIHGFIDSEDEKIRKWDSIFEEWGK